MLANKMNIPEWAVFLYINIDHEQLELLFFLLAVLEIEPRVSWKCSATEH